VRLPTFSPVLQETNKGKEQNKPLKMTLISVDINLHGKPPFQGKTKHNQMPNRV